MLTISLRPVYKLTSFLYAMQDVFNLLPNLSVEELLKSFAIKSNDMMLAVYLASMIRRSVHLFSYSWVSVSAYYICDVFVAPFHKALLACSVLALHNLIDNQEQRVWQEKLGQKRPELKNGKVRFGCYNPRATCSRSPLAREQARMDDQPSRCYGMKLDSFSHTYFCYTKGEVQPFVGFAAFSFCSVAIAGQG